jgi:hypothetical protein
MNGSNSKLGAAALAGLFLLSLGTFSGIPAEARGRFAQNHPRRAEVLHRDNHLNNRLNRDKGSLGGHYGQLRHEDNSIHRQERRDARANGGYITQGQKAQLNREENRMNRQIHRDHN